MQKRNRLTLLPNPSFSLLALTGVLVWSERRACTSARWRIFVAQEAYFRGPGNINLLRRSSGKNFKKRSDSVRAELRASVPLKLFQRCLGTPGIVVGTVGGH